MTLTTVPYAQLVAAVRTRLATVTNATGYDLEAVDVPLQPNSGGRAAPYWVLTPGLGSPGSELDLGDTTVDVDWLIQVTCAAGNTDDLTLLVDRVHVALFRWAPTVSGLVCGPFKPPPGYRPEVQTDRSVTPHRPFVPLQYVAPITAN